MVRGATDEVALYFLATFRYQDRALFFGCHAFCDHRNPKVAAETHDRAHDRGGMLVASEIRYEFAVDLDLVERV